VLTVDPAVDVVGDERVQGAGGPVGDDAHPAAPESSGRHNFYRNDDQCLLALGPPTGQSGLLAADVGLVYLHLPRQQLTTGTDQHRAQPVQHRPRRLVRADLQCSLQRERRDAVLGRGELPAHLKPHRQRRPSTIEQRARRYRGLGLASGALEAAVRDTPTTDVPTARAEEPVRPAQPLQVVQALRVRGEPRLELSQRPRVVHPTAWVIDRHHPSLVGSDG